MTDKQYLFDLLREKMKEPAGEYENPDDVAFIMPYGDTQEQRDFAIDAVENGLKAIITDEKEGLGEYNLVMTPDNTYFRSVGYFDITQDEDVMGFFRKKEEYQPSRIRRMTSQLVEEHSDDVFYHAMHVNASPYFLRRGLRYLGTLDELENLDFEGIKERNKTGYNEYFTKLIELEKTTPQTEAEKLCDCFNKFDGNKNIPRSLFYRFMDYESISPDFYRMGVELAILEMKYLETHRFDPMAFINSEIGFKRAIDINPESLMGITNLASLYMMAGKPEAINVINQGLVLDPNNPTLNDMRMDYKRQNE